MSRGTKGCEEPARFLVQNTCVPPAESAERAQVNPAIPHASTTYVVCIQSIVSMYRLAWVSRLALYSVEKLKPFYSSVCRQQCGATQQCSLVLLLQKRSSSTRQTTKRAVSFHFHFHFHSLLKSQPRLRRLLPSIHTPKAQRNHLRTPANTKTQR